MATTPPSGAGTNVALSVISHLGFFVLPVVLPLVFYVTVGKGDPDVRHHTREALNFQITFLIAWIVGFFFFFVAMFATIEFTTGPPLAFFLLFPVMFGLFFAAMGLSIFAAVQAGRGRTWRYPVSLRFVRRDEA